MRRNRNALGILAMNICFKMYVQTYEIGVHHIAQPSANQQVKNLEMLLKPQKTTSPPLQEERILTKVPYFVQTHEIFKLCDTIYWYYNTLSLVEGCCGNHCCVLDRQVGQLLVQATLRIHSFPHLLSKSTLNARTHVISHRELGLSPSVFLGQLPNR